MGGVFCRQLLLEERLSTGRLSDREASFVNMLWWTALSRLTGFISAPVEKLSLNDVSPSLPSASPPFTRRHRLTLGSSRTSCHAPRR